jgi:hypothetical protein
MYRALRSYFNPLGNQMLKTLAHWLKEIGVQTAYIEPGW